MGSGERKENERANKAWSIRERGGRVKERGWRILQE